MFIDNIEIYSRFTLNLKYILNAFVYYLIESNLFKDSLFTTSRIKRKEVACVCTHNFEFQVARKVIEGKRER